MAFSSEQDQSLANLMRLAQSGDKRSYDILLREVATLAKSFFQKRLGSVPAVDDLTQEALVSIHGSRHTFDCSRPFAPWMYAIIRSRLADYWRSECKRMKQEVEGLEHEHYLEPAEAFLGGGLTEAVAMAVSELPPRQRTVVTLLKVDGYSLKEAAQELRMTETAVKVTAHRAYNALRKKLVLETHEHE